MIVGQLRCMLPAYDLVLSTLPVRVMRQPGNIRRILVTSRSTMCDLSEASDCQVALLSFKHAGNTLCQGGLPLTICWPATKH